MSESAVAPALSQLNWRVAIGRQPLWHPENLSTGNISLAGPGDTQSRRRSSLEALTLLSD